MSKLYLEYAKELAKGGQLMREEYVLEVSNLKKKYGNKTVVKNIDLNISKGDVFGFLGPNGAGKTTTIRMILGLIKIDGGSVIVNGYNMKNNFCNAIEKIGAVVETPRFYEYLSAYKNLKQIANIHENVVDEKIKEVLEMVGLSKRQNEKVKNYSLGMKQRLGIARALLNNPQLVILDEPTNGLDPQGMKEVREMISELATKKDITFLISTHLLNEVEQICNRVAILNEGEIVIEGAVNDLLNRENETIEIYTENKDKELVKKYIKSLDYAECVSVTSKGIIIEVVKGYTSKLNSYLISKNVEVSYLIPRNESLEDYFIEITKGGEQIA